MMKIATLAAALAMASTASFAQTTGPSGQQDTNKPGMANPGSSTTTMSPDGMKKSNNMGTTGSSMNNQATPGTMTGPSGQTPKTDAK